MPGKVKGLAHWCKKVTEGYRGGEVTDMSSSWKNGLAFCALIHRFRPDLIDYGSLSPENVYENNCLAYSIAEKEFGIVRLLDPKDMAEMACPDRQSVAVYVSQLYDYFKDEPIVEQEVEYKDEVNELKVNSSDLEIMDNIPKLDNGLSDHVLSTSEGNVDTFQLKSVEDLPGNNDMTETIGKGDNTVVIEGSHEIIRSNKRDSSSDIDDLFETNFALLQETTSVKENANQREAEGSSGCELDADTITEPDNCDQCDIVNISEAFSGSCKSDAVLKAAVCAGIAAVAITAGADTETEGQSDRSGNNIQYTKEVKSDVLQNETKNNALLEVHDKSMPIPEIQITPIKDQTDPVFEKSIQDFNTSVSATQSVTPEVETKIKFMHEQSIATSSSESFQSGENAFTDKDQSQQGNIHVKEESNIGEYKDDNLVVVLGTIESNVEDECKHTKKHLASSSSESFTSTSSLASSHSDESSKYGSRNREKIKKISAVTDMIVPDRDSETEIFVDEEDEEPPALPTVGPPLLPGQPIRTTFDAEEVVLEGELEVLCPPNKGDNSFETTVDKQVSSTISDSIHDLPPLHMSAEKSINDDTNPGSNESNSELNSSNEEKDMNGDKMLSRSDSKCSQSSSDSSSESSSSAEGRKESVDDGAFDGKIFDENKFQTSISGCTENGKTKPDKETHSSSINKKKSSCLYHSEDVTPIHALPVMRIKPASNNDEMGFANHLIKSDGEVVPVTRTATSFQMAVPIKKTESLDLEKESEAMNLFAKEMVAEIVNDALQKVLPSSEESKEPPDDDNKRGSHKPFQLQNGVDLKAVNTNGKSVRMPLIEDALPSADVDSSLLRKAKEMAKKMAEKKSDVQQSSISSSAISEKSNDDGRIEVGEENMTKQDAEKCIENDKEEARARRIEILHQLQKSTRPIKKKLDETQLSKSDSSPDSSADFKSKMKMWVRKSSTAQDPDEITSSSESSTPHSASRKSFPSLSSPPVQTPTSPRDEQSYMQKLNQSVPSSPRPGSVAEYVRKLSLSAQHNPVAAESDRTATDDSVMLRKKRQPVDDIDKVPFRRSTGGVSPGFVFSRPVRNSQPIKVSVRPLVQRFSEKEECEGNSRPDSLSSPRISRDSGDFSVVVKPLTKKYALTEEEKNDKKKAEVQRRDSLNRHNPPKRELSINRPRSRSSSRERNIWQHDYEADAITSPTIERKATVARRDSFEVKVRPVSLLLTKEETKGGGTDPALPRRHSLSSANTYVISPSKEASKVNISVQPLSPRPWTQSDSVPSVPQVSPITEKMTLTEKQPLKSQKPDFSIGRQERQSRPRTSLSPRWTSKVESKQTVPKKEPLTVRTKHPGRSVLNYVQSCLNQRSASKSLQEKAAAFQKPGAGNSAGISIPLNVDNKNIKKVVSSFSQPSFNQQITTDGCKEKGDKKDIKSAVSGGSQSSFRMPSKGDNANICNSIFGSKAKIILNKDNISFPKDIKNTKAGDDKLSEHVVVHENQQSSSSSCSASSSFVEDMNQEEQSETESSNNKDIDTEQPVVNVPVGIEYNEPNSETLKEFPGMSDPAPKDSSTITYSQESEQSKGTSMSESSSSSSSFDSHKDGTVDQPFMEKTNSVAESVSAEASEPVLENLKTPEIPEQMKNIRPNETLFVISTKQDSEHPQDPSTIAEASIKNQYEETDKRTSDSSDSEDKTQRQSLSSHSTSSVASNEIQKPELKEELKTIVLELEKEIDWQENDAPNMDMLNIEPQEFLSAGTSMTESMPDREVVVSQLTQTSSLPSKDADKEVSEKDLFEDFESLVSSLQKQEEKIDYAEDLEVVAEDEEKIEIETDSAEKHDEVSHIVHENQLPSSTESTRSGENEGNKESFSYNENEKMDQNEKNDFPQSLLSSATTASQTLVKEEDELLRNVIEDSQPFRAPLLEEIIVNNPKAEYNAEADKDSPKSVELANIYDTGRQHTDEDTKIVVENREFQGSVNKPTEDQVAPSKSIPPLSIIELEDPIILSAVADANDITSPLEVNVSVYDSGIQDLDRTSPALFPEDEVLKEHGFTDIIGDVTEDDRVLLSALAEAQAEERKTKRRKDSTSSSSSSSTDFKDVDKGDQEEKLNLQDEKVDRSQRIDTNRTIDKTDAENILQKPSKSDTDNESGDFKTDKEPTNTEDRNIDEKMEDQSALSESEDGMKYEFQGKDGNCYLLLDSDPTSPVAKTLIAMEKQTSEKQKHSSLSSMSDEQIENLKNSSLSSMSDDDIKSLKNVSLSSIGDEQMKDMIDSITLQHLEYIPISGVTVSLKNPEYFLSQAFDPFGFDIIEPRNEPFLEAEIAESEDLLVGDVKEGSVVIDGNDKLEKESTTSIPEDHHSVQVDPKIDTVGDYENEEPAYDGEDGIEVVDSAIEMVSSDTEQANLNQNKQEHWPSTEESGSDTSSSSDRKELESKVRKNKKKRKSKNGMSNYDKNFILNEELLVPKERILTDCSDDESESHPSFMEKASVLKKSFEYPPGCVENKVEKVIDDSHVLKHCELKGLNESDIHCDLSSEIISNHNIQNDLTLNIVNKNILSNSDSTSLKYDGIEKYILLMHNDSLKSDHSSSSDSSSSSESDPEVKDTKVEVKDTITIDEPKGKVYRSDINLKKENHKLKLENKSERSDTSDDSDSNSKVINDGCKHREQLKRDCTSKCQEVPYYENWPVNSPKWDLKSQEVPKDTAGEDLQKDDKFLIGREKDPSKSEVARLIQQSLEQDRRRDEIRRQEQDRYKELQDKLKPRDEVLEHEHIRHLSETSSGTSNKDDDQVDLDESSQSDAEDEMEEMGEDVSEDLLAGEATPMSMPSMDEISSPDEQPEKPVVEVFDLQESSGDDISPDMESQALFVKLKEAQCKNAVLEAEMAKLKAKIIVLENTEGQKRQYEKKCEEMAARLLEMEKKLTNARKEINHYQDMLEGSQGQYIALEKKMQGEVTAVEKKYHKAKKIIKEYQQREKDFLAERESLLQQQTEKDQQYNALVKSLKDRIFQLEKELAEAQRAAGLPVHIPSQSPSHHVEEVVVKTACPVVHSAPVPVQASGSPVMSPTTETASVSSESDVSSSEPISLEADMDVADGAVNFEFIPKTELLDTSASRDKAQLASAMPSRRPPTKQRSKSEDSMEGADDIGKRQSGLESWTRHDSEDTVKKSEHKKRKAQQQGLEASEQGQRTETPPPDRLPPPPPPPSAPSPSLPDSDEMLDQSRDRQNSVSGDSSSTVSQTSYDPSKPSFRGMDSEIPASDTVSVDTSGTTETQGSGSSAGVAGSTTFTKKSKGIKIPKLPFKFGGGDKDVGGVVLVSNRSLNSEEDSEGGVTLVSKKNLDTGYDFDGASTISDVSSSYMVGELDEGGKSSTYNLSGTPVNEEHPSQASRHNQNQISSGVISQWNNEHVCHWLMGIEMDKYTQLFKEKSITGIQLTMLDSNKLKAMGITNAKDRELLKKKIKELKVALDKERKQLEKERKIHEKEQRAREREQKKMSKKK